MTSPEPGGSAAPAHHDDPEQVAVRKAKRARLLEAGGTAYPNAVERTHTTPVLPLEFSLSPITSERVRSVSPGTTGAWKRHSA